MLLELLERYWVKWLYREGCLLLSARACSSLLIIPQPPCTSNLCRYSWCIHTHMASRPPPSSYRFSPCPSPPVPTFPSASTCRLTLKKKVQTRRTLSVFAGSWVCGCKETGTRGPKIKESERACLFSCFEITDPPPLSGALCQLPHPKDDTLCFAPTAPSP